MENSSSVHSYWFGFTRVFLNIYIMREHKAIIPAARTYCILFYCPDSLTSTQINFYVFRMIAMLFWWQVQIDIQA